MSMACYKWDDGRVLAIRKLEVFAIWKVWRPAPAFQDDGIKDRLSMQPLVIEKSLLQD
jgi:hypothetical protein